MIRTLLFLTMSILLLTTLGCSRPKDSQTYVVIEAGDPIQAVDKKDGKGERIIVTGTTLKGNVVTTQDVTGWFMMPPSHWKIISAQIEKDKAEGRIITFPAGK